MLDFSNIGCPLRIPERYHAIDIHHHVWFSPEMKLNVPDFEAMLEGEAIIGVEKTGISLPVTKLRDVPPELFRAANDAVIDALHRSDRLFGFCFVDPGYPAEAVHEIRRCVEEHGFRGIKLYHQHTIDDEIQRPVMECAAELGVPVLMHAAAGRNSCSEFHPQVSHAEHFLNALKKFPETTLIQAHIGGGGEWEWMLAMLNGIDSDNFFIDIAGTVCDAEIISRTRDAVGIDRMLFATDMSLEESVAKAFSAGFREAELHKLFHDNWMRIAARKQG